MWASIGVLAEQVASQSPTHVRLSSNWLVLIIPVTVAAGTATFRAFTARDRLRRRYADDVAKARDQIRFGLVLPVLATIIVTAHPLVRWPKDGLSGMLQKGTLGDPEIDVQRRLVGRVFVDPLVRLGTHLGMSWEAGTVQDRLLGSERRQGWAAGVFLVMWLYLGFWASETGMALPHALTASAVIFAAVALGWFLAEWVSGAREAEAFSALVADVARLAIDQGDSG